MGQSRSTNFSTSMKCRRKVLVGTFYRRMATHFPSRTHQPQYGSFIEMQEWQSVFRWQVWTGTFVICIHTTGFYCEGADICSGWSRRCSQWSDRRTRDDTDLSFAPSCFCLVFFSKLQRSKVNISSSSSFSGVFCLNRTTGRGGGRRDVVLSLWSAVFNFNRKLFVPFIIFSAATVKMSALNIIFVKFISISRLLETHQTSFWFFLLS